MDSLINDFSNLSITNNNNNFDDEINEFMNIDIDYTEKFPCNDIKKELTSKEQFYINILNKN